MTALDRGTVTALDRGSIPEVQVQVKAEKFNARAFTAGPEQRPALWAQMIEIYGPYAQYQTKTDRQIPVVILKPISASGKS